MAILSVLALSSLGLLIGLMTGLSASPVVGSLVATLAALAVAWFGGKEQPGDAGSGVRSQYSTLTGVRRFD